MACRFCKHQWMGGNVQELRPTMLAKPTPEETQSLGDLNKRGSTAPAVAYIRRNLDALRKLNDHEQKTKTFRQRQGACQVLDKLLQAIEGRTRHDAE